MTNKPTNVISFASRRAQSGPTTSDNDLILMKLRGVPAQDGTPETDADPRNPQRFADNPTPPEGI